MTRVWPQEPIPHQGPQSRGGQRQLLRKSTVPSAKPGGIRPVLLGAPSRNTGAPEVTQSGQGNQEDLPGTGSRDGGQVWGHEGSLEKQAKDRQKGVFPEPQLAAAPQKDPGLQTAMRQPAGSAHPVTAARPASQEHAPVGAPPGRLNSIQHALCSEIWEGALVRKQPQSQN